MINAHSAAIAKPRIQSIDIARGLIMIIMTLDHVRDFLMAPGPSPLDMQSTTVILFFTRWITHFCAPTFVFLSGVSAYLAGQRRSRGELSSFLLKRGIWLILSDVIIISLIFTLDPGYHVLVLEVLTAIGAGMIILSALIYAPLWVTAAIGLVIFFGHNLQDFVNVDPQTTFGGAITVFLTAAGSVIPLGGKRIIAELYAILPWSSVLLLGYVAGRVYNRAFDAKRRRRLLIFSGIALCLIFVVLRLINHYGDPRPSATQVNAAHTFLSFLNATKQPPSLLYFSMTLGPLMLFLAFTESLQNKFSAVCNVFGNVPYFYFIMHLCFIRLLNIALVLVQGLPIKFNGHPLVWQADGFGFSLPVIYLLWLMVIVVLYFPAKRYGLYKRSHGNWWLSYV